MTWGVQNDEVEGHEQLEYAVKERGVTFVDTAEMYPVPMSDPRWGSGRTEEIIGTWLGRNPGMRDRVTIATKVMGYSPGSSVAAARTVPPPVPPSRRPP